VSTSFGGQTTRSINAALARSILPQRSAAAVNEPEKLRALIARVLNVRPRSGRPVVSEENGQLSIEVEPGLHIAATLAGSASPAKRPAVLYVNSAGKLQGAAAIQKLVEAGNAVLAIDPRGWGESAPAPRAGGYSTESQLAKRAMLLGKPLVGMQTFDTLRAFDYLSSLPGVDASRISITGVGGGGVVALFAAALEPRIVSAQTAGALESYLSVVEADIHQTPPGLLIPGVLKHFDLPDVKRAIAPRPVSVQ
jgi:hypothetical protein